MHIWHNFCINLSTGVGSSLVTKLLTDKMAQFLLRQGAGLAGSSEQRDWRKNGMGARGTRLTPLKMGETLGPGDTGGWVSPRFGTGEGGGTPPPIRPFYEPKGRFKHS